MRFVKIPTLAVFLLVASSCVDSQKVREELCLVSPATCSTINLKPMYGGVEKSEPFKQADKEYINLMIANHGSKTAGAWNVVNFGWKYLKQGDLVTAMKRFNQVWLLNPENFHAYWGFAIITARSNYPKDEVESYFIKSVELATKNAGPLVGYGFFLIEEKRYADARAKLTRALAIYPKAKNARYNMAISFFEQNDKANACKWAKRAVEAKDPVDEGFIKDAC